MTPTESKKPKEDDPKVAAVQTNPRQESVAQEATARQAIDRGPCPEGHASVAPGMAPEKA